VRQVSKSDSADSRQMVSRSAGSLRLVRRESFSN